MRLIAELRERLRALVQRAREDRELEEELRFHLEMEIEANLRRGLSPAEARRQAYLRLGGVTQVAEATRAARGVQRLEDLARDVRQGVRRLVREPGFSLPVVVTVALGIGVMTAVFALVNAVLIRPLPYPDSGRLVQVGHAASGVELAMTGLSHGTLAHYRDHNRVFDGIGAYVEHIYTLSDGGAPEQVRVALSSLGLLPTLGVAPQLGRLPTAEDLAIGERYAALISHDLWVRRYGADPGVIGRTIELDRVPQVVVGVMPPGFHFPHPETQVWAAWDTDWVLSEYGPSADVGDLYMNGVARLAPGVSIEQAQRDLDRLIRTLPDVYPDVTAARLERMGLRSVVVPLKTAIVGDVRVPLLLLAATGAFLLLITWANATSLSLARAERQRMEVAVERALGATAARLARRFLSESILIAAAGGTLGVALGSVAVRLCFGFDAGQIPRLGEVGMDGAAVAFAVGLALVTGVLLGTVPLVAARRPGFEAALTGAAGRMTAGRREQVGRRLLVTAQVALALTLLVGSALMARSFWRLHQVELGFRPEGALTFYLPIPPSEYGDYHRSSRVHHEILERLRALPGVDAVEAASMANFPLTPVPAYHNDRIVAADRPPGDSTEAPYALHGFATPGYFEAMGIPLLRGRTFQRIDTSRDAHGVILSASLARALFGDEDPIGRRVRWAGTSEYPPYTVVGVVGDVPSQGLAEGPSRVMYFPNIYPPQADTVTFMVHVYIPSDEMYIVRTRLDPLSLVPAIRRAIDEVDPKLVMARVGLLEDVVARSMAQARLTMLLLLVGALTALALGVSGIYGILSYSVRRRTQELGVRIALGATSGQVVRMVVREGARLALAGIAVGLLAAFALTRFLRSLLYEVSPGDPLAFVSAAALLLGVALLASYVPARRAGRIDPVEALKAM